MEERLRFILELQCREPAMAGRRVAPGAQETGEMQRNATIMAWVEWKGGPLSNAVGSS